MRAAERVLHRGVDLPAAPSWGLGRILGAVKRQGHDSRRNVPMRGCDGNTAVEAGAPTRREEVKARGGDRWRIGRQRWGDSTASRPSEQL